MTENDSASYDWKAPDCDAVMESRVVPCPEWYVKEVIEDGYLGVELPPEEQRRYFEIYEKKRHTAPFKTRAEERNSLKARERSRLLRLKNAEKQGRVITPRKSRER